MMKSKWLLTTRLLILMLAGVLGMSAAWAQSTPDDTVRAVLQDVISDIKTEKASKGAAWNQQAAISLIERKVAPHFDFTRMTAIAVGRDWAKATDAQKAELTKEFHRLIVRTYANTVTDYENETIDVRPLPASEAAKDSTTVRAQVNRTNGQPVRIDIAVRKRGNTWQVYDVSVAGVSIVMNFRSTFESEVKQNGIDGLIKSLKDRNAKNA